MSDRPPVETEAAAGRRAHPHAGAEPAAAAQRGGAGRRDRLHHASPSWLIGLPRSLFVITTGDLDPRRPCGRSTTSRSSTTSDRLLRLLIRGVRARGRGCLRRPDRGTARRSDPSGRLSLPGAASGGRPERRRARDVARRSSSSARCRAWTGRRRGRRPSTTTRCRKRRRTISARPARATSRRRRRRCRRVRWSATTSSSGSWPRAEGVEDVALGDDRRARAPRGRARRRRRRAARPSSWPPGAACGPGPRSGPSCSCRRGRAFRVSPPFS